MGPLVRTLRVLVRTLLALATPPARHEGSVAAAAGTQIEEAGNTKGRFSADYGADRRRARKGRASMERRPHGGPRGQAVAPQRQGL